MPSGQNAGPVPCRCLLLQPIFSPEGFNAGGPHFTAFHRCHMLHKLKVRPSVNKKVTTRITA